MKINNLASLRQETERLEYKLKVDKSRLRTDFQLLRYEIIEYALKEFIGLFRKSEPEKKPGPGSKERRPGSKKKGAGSEMHGPGSKEKSAGNEAQGPGKDGPGTG
jgi:hypothetical protein